MTSSPAYFFEAIAPDLVARRQGREGKVVLAGQRSS